MKKHLDAGLLLVICLTLLAACGSTTRQMTMKQMTKMQASTAST